jgi:hypothetical protein
MDFFLLYNTPCNDLKNYYLLTRSSSELWCGQPTVWHWKTISDCRGQCRLSSGANTYVVRPRWTMSIPSDYLAERECTCAEHINITKLQIKPMTTWFFMCTTLISLARLPNWWARCLMSANYPSKMSKSMFCWYNHPIFWLECLCIKSRGQVQWLWSYNGSYMLVV